MSESPRPLVPSQPQSQKRKSTPPPSPRPLTREVQQTQKRPATEIPEEPTADPPTKPWLCMKDGAQPPTPSRRRRPPGRPARTTQQASIPTWGQIKSLCHQAQGIASLQGSSASPERVFIAMLALLSCQNSPAEHSEACD
ncbi:hypothetical protein FD754_024453 [Muntiacus muntjak]|uniref:Uncharacterized protein n=1 Tax=Muntiacus muntjak TaxID=9888 RepID=A0A5N3UPH5_MUNMU|nr:hypothetical protein FD754_024454 [Muntiacus muntjak]KAB0338613.1 hypothetical protein FD754_024453 [Muntiacus muntjak]